MIYTITLNPAMDKTVEIPGFAVDKVNRVTQLRCDPGGKGINVSKVISALGGQSRALCILGGATGQKIAEALQAQGIAADAVIIPQETRTNLKVVDPQGCTNTDINESGEEVDGAVLDEVLNKLTDTLQKDDIVVLAGSLPKGAPPQLYRDWTRLCKERQAKVFLDADKEMLRLGLEAAPYLIKPNSDELAMLCGHPLATEEEIRRAGEDLVRQGIELVLISLGADGSMLVTKEGVLWARGLKVPVSSTVGAGDSMVASFAYSLAAGQSLRDALALATAVSAATVMCPGTQAADPVQVQKLLPQVELIAL